MKEMFMSNPQQQNPNRPEDKYSSQSEADRKNKRPGGMQNDPSDRNRSSQDEEEPSQSNR
jgi:hypothetical protein